MAAIDFLNGPDGNLLIQNGDFVVGPSDEQHNLSIMRANPGDWKEYPLVGFGPYKYLNSRATSSQLNRNARIQLKADGCEDSTIKTDLYLDPNGVIKGFVNGKRL